MCFRKKRACTLSYWLPCAKTAKRVLPRDVGQDVLPQGGAFAGRQATVDGLHPIIGPDGRRHLDGMFEGASALQSFGNPAHRSRADASAGVRHQPPRVPAVAAAGDLVEMTGNQVAHPRLNDILKRWSGRPLPAASHCAMLAVSSTPSLLIHESPLTDALFLLVSKSDEVTTT